MFAMISEVALVIHDFLIGYQANDVFISFLLHIYIHSFLGCYIFLAKSRLGSFFDLGILTLLVPIATLLHASSLCDDSALPSALLLSTHHCSRLFGCFRQKPHWFLARFMFLFFWQLSEPQIY